MSKQDPSYYEQILSQLLATDEARHSDNGCPVIAVTSRKNGEGVSTVCANLATTYTRSHQQEVLLIDSAPNRHDLATIAGPEYKTLDESILLEDAWNKEYLEKSLSQSNYKLTLLTVTDRKQLKSPVWKNTFNRLRTHFDLVIVDTGSLTSETPHAWSNLSSLNVLVIDTTTNTAIDLERLGAKISATSFKLHGAILNKKPFYVPNFIYKYLY